ncbi:hypothetical protein PQ465_12205 [Sphingobacterium oryzagri]|uniref:Lipoprotein n=1 Tax=Sphingobacterium oryzagri TaxID=3025669 RepID=A0ABY7WBQ3_9SPHI|nr:hypothetical protein [Sphingobacterium sp. KACC 22765]WDF67068.1 hypothetical protein PQ465_12205 [Sphingobacterium sp. KACC 22765]
MKLNTALIYPTLLLIMSGCAPSNQSETSNQCDFSKPILDSLKNESGTFGLDESDGRYFVSIHTEGTIDEVSSYIICNPPGSLPELQKNVMISGNVRNSSRISNLAGLTYFELELTDLEEVAK